MITDTDNEGIIECNLLIDGSRGVYIPQVFAMNFDPDEWQLTDENSRENLDVLKYGPEHENYWDAWDDILTAATHVTQEGALVKIWTLLQDDGDLFAVRYEVQS